jgi:hypothetical protein
MQSGASGTGVKCNVPQFPTARDGHFSAIFDSEYLFIFGGDRHMMSFNDLYYIKLTDIDVC